jgi:hypothetical protein
LKVISTPSPAGVRLAISPALTLLMKTPAVGPNCCSSPARLMRRSSNSTPELIHAASVAARGPRCCAAVPSSSSGVRASSTQAHSRNA